MASLTWHRKGYRIRYRLYFPDGTSVVRFAERTAKRDAEQLAGQAEKLESLTRQNALSPEVAIPFVHWRLLAEADLAHWFPHQRGRIQFARDVLVEEYRKDCRRQMTSARAIPINRLRAEHLLDRVGIVSQLTEQGVRDWMDARLEAVTSKTVNLELDVLRQLIDLCQRLGWRPDNPARAVKKLPWKLSRLPQALRYVQVQEALRLAWEDSQQAPATTLKGSRYRLLVAGMFFGLRRGELQHLVYADTNGRQVYVQGKTLPDGRA